MKEHICITKHKCRQCSVFHYFCFKRRSDQIRRVFFHDQSAARNNSLIASYGRHVAAHYYYFINTIAILFFVSFICRQQPVRRLERDSTPLAIQLSALCAYFNSIPASSVELMLCIFKSTTTRFTKSRKKKQINRNIMIFFIHKSLNANVCQLKIPLGYGQIWFFPNSRKLRKSCLMRIQSVRNAHRIYLKTNSSHLLNTTNINCSRSNIRWDNGP